MGTWGVKLKMESGSYKFNLDNHSKFRSKVLQSLYEDDNFTDVTLACEDGHQLKAHRAVLSTCSPFFQNILKKNQSNNMVLYLSGTNYKDLSSILKFVYLGECDVPMNEVENFLFTARSLKVDDLQEVKGTNTQCLVEKSISVNSVFEKNISIDSFSETSINSLFEKSVKQSFVPAKKSKKEQTSNHNKKFQVKELKKTFLDNVEVAVIKEKVKDTNEDEAFVGIMCNECDHKSPDYPSLKKHKFNIHNNKMPELTKKKPETQRDKSSIQATIENLEPKIKHFSCIKCDYQGNSSSDFKIHMESVHKRYILK